MSTFTFAAMARISLIAVAASLAVHGALAQQVELKLGHVGEPGSLFQSSADEYAKRVNAKRAGKVKVVVYGSSQLGGDKEMVQKAAMDDPDLMPLWDSMSGTLWKLLQD